MRNWVYNARFLRRGNNKGRIEMDRMSNQIHSRRTAKGIPMFRGAVMAGLLASSLVTALPSITFADGDGNRGKHSLVQQPHAYGLKSKSPFAATFATMSTLQASLASIEGLAEDVAGLNTKVNQLTVDNTKLKEDNMRLTAALAAANADISTMKVSVAALDTKAADIIPGLGKYLKVDTTNELNGVIGPHILFSGVNVHVRNGSGVTDNNNAPYQGLGNLVVGYNEFLPGVSRNGSHNLVGGGMNSFSSVGGMVFGFQNAISGQYASVLGGNVNTAMGPRSTVYGGWNNMAANMNSYSPLQGTRPGGTGQ